MRSIGFVLACVAQTSHTWRSRERGSSWERTTTNLENFRGTGFHRQSHSHSSQALQPEATSLALLSSFLLASSPRYQVASHHRLARRHLPLKVRSQPPVAAMDPSEIWSSYLNLLAVAPLPTKAATAGVIIGAGDCAAQLIEGVTAKKEFELARALRWAFFGLVLQGPWNHAFYLLLDGALPPTPDPWTVTTLQKVFIDQFVQAPIFTIIILGFFRYSGRKRLGLRESASAK